MTNSLALLAKRIVIEMSDFEIEDFEIILKNNLGGAEDGQLYRVTASKVEEIENEEYSV